MRNPHAFGPVRGTLLVAALLLPGRSDAREESRPGYVLGVLPQATPLAMYQRWNPLVERLAVRTGVPLRLKVYEDMGAFERDFLAGGPDLIFAHPLMAVDAHRRQGYEPLVRDRRQITAFLFVRKDSPFHDVGDLDGRRIAFVGSSNYCTGLVEAMLARSESRPRFDRHFAGSSLNVLRAVILGRAEAGATLDLAFQAEPEEMRELVRPILTSGKTAFHPVAAHPRVPKGVRDQLIAAILGMAKAPDDRALLAGVSMPDPEGADYERDYRSLEAMR